ncbi:MAG: glycosyltransferase [Endozoicomonadaceae bacterium]|nr:glycosyltransferase [Endozoicomonadaceae bacterium]
MKNKRLIFLIFGLEGGGVERMCVNIANALAEKGWDITLVVQTLENAVYLESLSDKVELVNLKCKRSLYAIFPILKFLVAHKHSSVVLHEHLLTTLVVILRLLFKLKIKIFTINNCNLSMMRKDTKNSQKKWFKNFLINQFYFYADKIINVSYGVQKDLIKLYPGIENKCSVIYNTVYGEIERIAQNTKKTDKEKYILYAGRLEQEKSIHYAIEAFALARPFLKGNYYLKIVGQGSLEKELKNLVKCLKIEQHVLFEGFQKNITSYYLKAKATLLSSTYEGFGNVLIESIMLGTPIISFDCPSGPDEIINDLNGKLVKFGDVKGLSRAIIDVCNSEYDIESVQSTAHRYRSDKIVKEYEQLLNSL